MYNSIYPNLNIKPYVAPYNKQAQQKNVENDLEQEKKPRQEQTFPNGEKTTIDYSKSTVNVAQIITDFNNTARAIGAPEEISEEVNGYLGLIQKESQKDAPSKEIIHSNFKNASKILDKYITDTLDKPSKVVEGWIDALFLQKIDYKSDPEAINPAFSVQLPPKKETEQTQNAIQTPQPQTEEKIQEEKAQTPPSPLKSLVAQAKKEADPKNSLNILQNALKTANEAGDKETAGIIYYESAKILDKYDKPELALSSYNNAILTSSDPNIQTRAHLNMAKIYDEFIEFEPALEHCQAAIAICGEADNLYGQTVAFNQTATLFANRYDRPNTFEILDTALEVAQISEDPKAQAAVHSKTAWAHTKFGEYGQALLSHKNAITNYDQTQNHKKTAQEYLASAELMSEKGYSKKATALRNKAFLFAQKTNDEKLIEQIRNTSV